MLFCKATVKEVKGIKRIMDIFMEDLCMEVNKEKYCTFVFNTLESVKSHLTRTLGFRQGELPTKYLGDQIDFHRTRMVNWLQVIEKNKNKMAGWAFKTMNIAGCIVLVKSVLQAIPIYPLSIIEAPKGACSKIKELYNKFIWGVPNQQRKWALVSRKHLSKRKEEGGLGLRDPEMLNRVLGAKLWWRWMRGGNDLSKKIWTHKYNIPRTTEEILRVEETPKGSSIWNLASQNRSIVNRHAFWEIRGGRNARFWEEGWQQRDKPGNIQTLQNIQQKALREGCKYVKDYWREGVSEGIWRKWRKPEEWMENINQEQQKEYEKEVESRKIKERMEVNLEWKIIWEGKWWPKIALFALLVGKERILTWSLLGPSKCSLCNRENETEKHVLNNCLYAVKIWNETGKLYGKERGDLKDIKRTIFLWNKEKFNCKVIKRAWDLTVGFTIWFLWKERNRRIFLDKHIKPEETWKGILRAVQETILSEDWSEEGWKTNQEEGQILVNLNMKYEMVYPIKEIRQNKQAQSPEQFNYRKENFIKLNFDGASKGNPGNTGFGGIFRESEENIRWIYAEWGGEMTNNEAELSAVHRGLRIAVRNNFRNLEIEGDSQVVIEMIRKLNKGKNWEQIVSSWRTAGIVQDVGEILKSFYYLIINHVRMKGNRAADFLANWGINDSEGKVDSSW
eukprot:PITA_25949